MFPVPAMKKIILGFLLSVFSLFFVVAVVRAADPCSPCDPCTSFDNIFDDYRCSGSKQKSLFGNIEFSGWLQGGVYANTRGATTRRLQEPDFRGRVVSFQEAESGNSALLSTVDSTDILLNQLWLVTKKEADGSRGLDWGFGAEFLFGQDAWLCQSWNDAQFDYNWQDGDYYSSIPQLYVQLAYSDWSVKFGKYETFIGSEAVQAKDMFFYSHNHLFLTEPYSHTGALVEYTPNDQFFTAFGYTTGNDTSFENRYDDHGIISYTSYQFTSKLKLSYAFVYTRFSNQEVYPSLALRDNAGENQYFHTICAHYDLTKRLAYLFQWNFGDAKHRQTNTHRLITGISNTFQYQIDKNWGAGLRAEWVRDKNGEYLGYYVGDIFGLTLGLNWKPCKNVMFTPEIRYDRVSGSSPFNYGRNRDQVSGGVGATVMF